MHGRAAMLTMLSLQAGCLGTRGCTEVTYHQRVTSSAVQVASGGVAAVGPLGRPGRVFFEGTVSRHVVRDPAEVETAGPEGARVVHTVARGRVAYTLRGGTELGATFQAADSEWNSVAMRGPVLVEPPGRALYGTGVQVRHLAMGDRSLGLGIQAELSLVEATWAHEYVTDVSRREGGGGTTSGTARGTSLLATPTVGLFGVIALARGLQLTTGGAFGLGRDVVPSREVSASCDASDRCSDDPPAGESPFRLGPQFTAWAALGYTLGPATLLAQVHGEVFGAAPFGATLGVRVAP